jgi:two-component system response regulator ResD
MPATVQEQRLRILLVEDDPRLRAELLATLGEAGYEASFARSLAEARRRARHTPDVILLDLVLPDGNGLTLCQELRRAGVDVPIIAITARDAIEQRVEGLDAGVDDYLVKPFSVVELLARIRSATRRYLGKVASDRLAVGDLWLDPRTKCAGRGDVELEFTPQEFELLQFLLQNPGVAWSREQLLRHAWGLSHAVGDQRTVDTHVRRLRVKIEDDPARPRILCTVWGAGYRLDGAR